MTESDGDDDTIVLPSTEYWHRMRMNPETVMDNVNLHNVEDLLGRFGLSDLDEFFSSTTGKTRSASKVQFIRQLTRRFPVLTNTLIMVAQYAIWVAKNALIECCTECDIDTDGLTRQQLSLRLYNKAPEKLRRARISSIGHRLQTTHAFALARDGVETGIPDDDMLETISQGVEDELSTSEQRAEMIERYYDESKETYRMFVKYEDRERKIEEWDGGHYYKPVDWVIVDYHPLDGYASLRCRDEERAKTMACLLSRGLTGRDDSYTQIELQEWNNDSLLESKPEIDSEDFTVNEWDIRMLRIKDSALPNRPDISLRGLHLDETIEKLKEDHGLKLTHGAEIVSYEIRVDFEFKGVSDETIIRYSKNTGNLGFAKETHEQVKKMILQSLPSILGV